MLERLKEVGAVDPQVALTLLRMCGRFFRLAHLARATPPSLIMASLELLMKMFVDDFHHALQLIQLMLPGSKPS